MLPDFHHLTVRFSARAVLGACTLLAACADAGASPSTEAALPPSSGPTSDDSELPATSPLIICPDGSVVLEGWLWGEMNTCPDGSSSTPGGLGGGGLPPVSDYGAPGPFATTVAENTGPDGNYTVYRPASLGDNAFRHPIATWGNGIITDPSFYPELLSTIASHGFVVVASNSSTVYADLLTAGLDWLIAQNSAPGVYQGKLDPSRAVSIGYSLGGGAAVDAGSHPNVIATISFHGLQGASEQLRGPLLLFTGTEDWFVSAEAFVTPTYERSRVQTFYATLTGAGHLYPLGNAGDERAPAIAWLRLWVYGDQGARAYFYGDNCRLCQGPWVSPQRKNWR